MADEPENDTPETADEAPEQAPAPEAAGDEPVEAAASADADGAQSEQPPEPEAEAKPEAEADAGAEDAQAADAVGEDAPAVAADAPPTEPAEQISAKERRRRARSKHSGEARASRSP